MACNGTSNQVPKGTAQRVPTHKPCSNRGVRYRWILLRWRKNILRRIRLTFDKTNKLSCVGGRTLKTDRPVATGEKIASRPRALRKAAFAASPPPPANCLAASKRRNILSKPARAGCPKDAMYPSTWAACRSIPERKERERQRDKHGTSQGSYLKRTRKAGREHQTTHPAPHPTQGPPPHPCANSLELLQRLPQSYCCSRNATS